MGDIHASSFSDHRARGFVPLPGRHQCAFTTVYSIPGHNGKLCRWKDSNFYNEKQTTPSEPTTEKVSFERLKWNLNLR